MALRDNLNPRNRKSVSQLRKMNNSNHGKPPKGGNQLDVRHAPNLNCSAGQYVCWRSWYYSDGNVEYQGQIETGTSGGQWECCDRRDRSHRRGGRVGTRKYSHGGMMRNGECAPGEYCHGGDVHYGTGGRTNSCPPGQHMMPDGTCMMGDYHGQYGHGGRTMRGNDRSLSRMQKGRGHNNSPRIDFCAVPGNCLLRECLSHPACGGAQSGFNRTYKRGGKIRKRRRR